MHSEEFREVARLHSYGSLCLDPDPEVGFLGPRALRQLADFCETYRA